MYDAVLVFHDTVLVFFMIIDNAGLLQKTVTYLLDTVVPLLLNIDNMK